jgi:putative ABC transport system permease protein
MFLLLRSSARHLSKHPLLTALSVLGIALGVAVVVSIDVANESARHAFALSSRAVAGNATHQIVGGPAGLDEGLYVRLRRELGALAAAPVVEGYAASPREPGRALRVLGLDPFAEVPFRAYTAPAGKGGLRALLTEPMTAAVSPALRARLGIAPLGRLVLSIDGVTKELSLAADLDAPGDALDDLVIADISTAQELFDRRGKLSRIDLVLSDEATRERIERACGCEVIPALSRSNALVQMTRAFSLNLSALSLLALVVGMFLIYNTMTFSIVQRRAILGTLRALGVTRKEVFTMVAVEAIALAIPATALGLALGLLLATELVRLVTRTINDLYFVLEVRSIDVDLFTLAKGSALGIGATLVAALAPAWEATRVPPTITLRRSSAETALARSAPRWALAGTGLVALAIAGLATSGRSLFASYAGLFAILLGAALATPLATRTFASLVRWPAGFAFGIIGKMAARGITASLSRTSVALAALTIAVATTVGVGIMVASFRGTVSAWLATSLQSDIFVQPPSLVSRRGEGTLAPDVVRRILTTEGIAAVNTIRNRRVKAGESEADLHVPSFGAARARPYRFREQEGPDVLRILSEEDAIAVTEPYAFHHATGLGERVPIVTDRGVVSFRVAGVYADYASDEGGILMSRPTYERYFDDRGISALAIVAAPGVDRRALLERVRERAGSEQTLTVRANRELREASLAIFDRTFAITQILRLLSIGVAFVGILSALMALSLERARELAVLRATGMTPRQLVELVTLQTSLMGSCAGLLSIPLGIGLAFVLVYVINRRSFGWTLDLVLSWKLVAEAMLLSLVAALVAGLYPAWKMSRQNPALALRDE